MNAQNATAFDFDADRDIDLIPQLLSSCQRVTRSDGDSTLELYLSSNRELDDREIGRILIVNGKCRNRRIKLALNCDRSVSEQLTRNGVARLVWVERILAD